MISGWSIKSLISLLLILPVKFTRKTYVGPQLILTAVCWVATQFPKNLMGHDTKFRNPEKSSGPTDTLFMTGP